MATSLSQPASVIEGLLLALSVGSIAIAALALRDARRVRNRFRELLDGAKGDTLELLLRDHLRERLVLQKEVEDLGARARDLEDRMLRTKSRVGFVRYDAFDDVGGAQSFALAIFDELGNGAVVNSLVGRTDCRVYCKQLIGGKADRSLSEEEQRAVESALRIESAR